LASYEIQLVILRALLEYVGDRSIVGTIEFSSDRAHRIAHLLTLEDGEHLLLLVSAGKLQELRPGRRPLEQLKTEASDWIVLGLAGS